MIFDELFRLIRKRQKDMPKDSYVADLFRNGKDRIIQKVGEESVEVLIAAKNSKKKILISELSDLFFNLFILMVVNGISLENIENELVRRKDRLVNRSSK